MKMTEVQMVVGVFGTILKDCQRAGKFGNKRTNRDHPD